MWKEVKLKTVEQLQEEGWTILERNDRTWGLESPDKQIGILPYQTVYLGTRIKVNFNKDGSFEYRDSWYPTGLVEGALSPIEQVENRIRKEIGIKKKVNPEDDFEMEMEVSSVDLDEEER